MYVLSFYWLQFHSKFDFGCSYPNIWLQTTAKDLQKTLSAVGHDMSLMTVYRLRESLGWKYARTKYCQQIREKNVHARLAWCQDIYTQMQSGFDFDDVIFTDESKIQIDRYARKSWRRNGCQVIWQCFLQIIVWNSNIFQIKIKGLHKHPQSVLVWAGISRRGKTKIVIFKGLMDADFYTQHVLRAGLLQFAREAYGTSYKLMQDNGKYFLLYEFLR